MTHRRHWFVAVLMLGAGAQVAAQQSANAPSTAGLPASVASLERSVDSLFAREISATGPGCAVGVYQNGAVVLKRGYGLANAEEGRPITPHTTFDLGSASKPFTALAALDLQRRGVLSLDDDVRRWVPELPNYGAPIRVRDLIQHTSGLRDFQSLGPLSGRPILTMPEFLGLLSAQQALNFTTGTRHEYSHSDYLLLGLVIERAVGIPFGEYLEREVLAPMGMRGSFVDDGSGRPQLVLRRNGHPDVSVWPIERDQFLRGLGAWTSPLNVHMQFHRGNAGQIMYLSISTPPGEDSVRGVRFVRVVPR